MALLVISFIAGMLTILAPCILPLLPVVVGRSLSDATLSRRRLFAVVFSLGLSVTLFTLLLKATALFIDIPQDFWRYISGGIIFIFGVVTLFPSIWEKISFTNLVNRKSNEVLAKGYQKNNLWGDIIVGASLGPIFSACSPTYFVILATVLPAQPLVGVIYLLTYSFGLCMALVLVALLGQKIITKLNFAADTRGWFKKTLGIIFIIVALGILTGYDKKLQISLLDAGFFDVTKIEQKLLDEESAPDKDREEEAPIDFLSLEEKKEKFAEAPDLSSIDGYINTDGKPITIREFKGKKVVLLDIWTYSCINCQRTLPYLNEWHKKYEDEGLVIIGLHTPEFAFEHVQKNVENAVKEFGVKYPVVLDNDFSTWRAYRNQYWPRKYLIDIDGFVVYDHAGEGKYQETEKAIQNVLEERKQRLSLDMDISKDISEPVNKVEVQQGRVQSPEIYFGSERNEYLANFPSNGQNFTIPSKTDFNKLYLGGAWTFAPEYAENAGGGEVIFKYHAKNVYMVAHSEKGADVEVYVDEQLVDTLHFSEEKLYDIVKGVEYGPHTLKLKIKKGSVKMYTFTFG